MLATVLEKGFKREHKRSAALSRVLVDTAGESAGDFGRFVKVVTALRSKKLVAAVLRVLEGLGTYEDDANSYDRTAYSAHPSGAAKQLRKLVSLFSAESDQIDHADAEFLSSYLTGRFRSACVDTVGVSVGVSGQYTYPDCCCGCLSPDSTIQKLKDKDSEYQSDGTTIKRTWEVSLPFCRKCRGGRSWIVELEGSSVRFSNVHYGFAFVVANGYHDYTCYTAAKEHSPQLQGMLERRGLPDMTRGVPWETMRDYLDL